MDKNFVKGLSFLLFIIVLIAGSGHYMGKKQAVNASREMSFYKTVIVDAGHGGLTNTVN